MRIKSRLLSNITRLAVKTSLAILLMTPAVALNAYTSGDGSSTNPYIISSTDWNLTGGYYFEATSNVTYNTGLYVNYGSSSSPETDYLLIRTSGVVVTYQSARVCYTDNCTAYVNISNGGSLQTTTGNINVAYRGNGTLNVSGTGSSAISGAGTAYVGYNANAVGNVNVTTSGTYTASNLSLGYYATSSGTLTVNGSGSTASVGSVLTVGVYGTGSVVLQSGASLTTTGSTYLGYNTGGAGSISISGGAHWGSAATTLGYYATGSGTVSLTDSGSYWADSGGLTIGSTGTGTLTISDGALVSVGGTLAIGSNGVIQLDGGYLAIKSASQISASTIASTYNIDIYSGSSYISSTSDNITTVYFSNSAEWQASSLYSSYSSLDLSGYTLIYAAVPEPSACAFFGGIAALGIALKLRRRK